MKGKIFTWGLVGLVLGIAGGQKAELKAEWLVLGSVFLGLILFFGRGKEVSWVIFCGGVCFIGGLLRVMAVGGGDEGRILTGYWDREVELSGVVDEWVVERWNERELVVKVSRIEETRGNLGKILVKAPLYPDYEFGQQLVIRGYLFDPGEFDGFSYRDFLARQGVYGIIREGEIEVVGDRSNPFLRRIYGVKSGLIEHLNQSLREPGVSVLTGIMMGEKKSLPEEWRDNFARAGLSHVMVVSGLHVSLVGAYLLALGRALSLPRKISFWLILTGLFLFIVLVGFSSSIIRAGVMCSLVLVSQQAGRLSDSRRALLLVGAIMLFLDPTVLMIDVGFQLSFLATWGILTFGRKLTSWLAWLPDWMKFREVAAMSLAATLYTFPVVVDNFGQVPALGVVSNLVVLPLLPILVIYGLVIGIWPGWGETVWLAWGLDLLLEGLVFMVECLSSLPGAVWQISSHNWIWFGWGVVVLLTSGISESLIKLIRTKTRKGVNK